MFLLKCLDHLAPTCTGQGLRIVKDFRELNQNTHIDKYCMMEFTECISDIGQDNSTIFTMLDLTSGFWQMQLDGDSQKLTTFTIPSKVSSIGSPHLWDSWDAQPVSNN